MNAGANPTFARNSFANFNSNTASASDGPPAPYPPLDAFIHLPADQYLHPQAPTEWWWHIGTLKAGDRTFGFEINAASFQFLGLGFTQVMLTDVSNKAHYQQSVQFSAQSTPPFNPNTWAESNPDNDWNVNLGTVTMHAPQSDPMNMKVTASLIDEATQTEVSFDLTLSQDGLPLIVWGIGTSPPPAPTPVLQNNNFYYSLTRLQASGTITLAGETFDVTGMTWMDHEYGKFGTSSHPVKWILQDMQLENGVCIQNYTTVPPQLGLKTDGLATVQMKDGTLYFVSSFVTPTEPWTSPETHATYFMNLEIEIPAFDASFTVRSLVESQEFTFGPVYEGVASAEGVFNGEKVSGTAWNEQALPSTPSMKAPHGRLQ